LVVVVDASDGAPVAARNPDTKTSRLGFKRKRIIAMALLKLVMSKLNLLFDVCGR
jgi:hypothetical protein